MGLRTGRPRGCGHFVSGARAGPAAGLCGDGAGLAVVGDRSAQSVSRGRIFFALLREALARIVRRRLILVPDMPRSYVPTLFALKLPEIFLVLGFGGAAGALVAAIRRDIVPNRARGPPAARARRPAAARRHGRAAAGDVQRHPAFRVRRAAVRGAAAAWPAPGSCDGCAALAACRDCCRRHRRCRASPSPIVEMVRLHPYEYTHFNRLCRRRRARARPLHARLLGALVQTGLAGAAGRARRATRDEAGRTAAGRSPSAARTARPRSSSAPISRSPGIPGRRLRHDARRVLLRDVRCADPGRDRARGRRLCPRLRHSRAILSDPADPAGPLSPHRLATRSPPCLALSSSMPTGRCSTYTPPSAGIAGGRPRRRPLLRNLAEQAARIHLDADARRELSSISGP